MPGGAPAAIGVHDALNINIGALLNQALGDSRLLVVRGHEKRSKALLAGGGRPLVSWQDVALAASVDGRLRDDRRYMHAGGRVTCWDGARIMIAMGRRNRDESEKRGSGHLREHTRYSMGSR